MACLICEQKIKGTVVRCLHCQAISCRICAQEHLLSLEGWASCLHCEQIWSCEDLTRNFSKIFLDQHWRPHYRRSLVRREKASIYQHNVKQTLQEYEEYLSLLQLKQREIHQDPQALDLLVEEERECQEVIDTLRDQLLPVDSWPFSWKEATFPAKIHPDLWDGDSSLIERYQLLQKMISSFRFSTDHLTIRLKYLRGQLTDSMWGKQLELVERNLLLKRQLVEFTLGAQAVFLSTYPEAKQFDLLISRYNQGITILSKYYSTPLSKQLVRVP